MLENLHTTFSQPKYKSYVKPKKASDKTFCVDHYAGEVVYAIEGFVEKNKDELSPDVLEMLTVKSQFASLVELAKKDEEKKDLDEYCAMLRADPRARTPGRTEDGGVKRLPVGLLGPAVAGRYWRARAVAARFRDAVADIARRVVACVLGGTAPRPVAVARDRRGASTARTHDVVREPRTRARGGRRAVAAAFRLAVHERSLAARTLCSASEARRGRCMLHAWHAPVCDTRAAAGESRP